MNEKWLRGAVVCMPTDRQGIHSPDSDNWAFDEGKVK